MFKIACLAAAFAAAAFSPALAQEMGGAYVGADIGYGKPKSEITYTPLAGAALKGEADKAGVDFGGLAGYGAVVGDSVYLAIEGGLGGGGGKSSNTFGATKVTLEPKLRYSVAGRAGLLIGEAGLLYGKAGIERRKVEVSTATSKEDLDLQGVLYGVGYQQMLGEGFALRAEVVRVDYGDKTARFGSGGSAKIESDETRFSLGGALHF